MGELGFEKLLLIAVVVLLLFGAKRLPEVGASLGQGIRAFKRGLADAQGEMPNKPADHPAALGQPTSTASHDAAGEPKRLAE